MTQHGTQQMKQRVGRNLATARIALDLTQREVGEAVGAAGPDVSRWENGRVEPGPFYRQQLADLLFGGDVSAMYREPELEEAA